MTALRASAILLALQLCFGPAARGATPFKLNGPLVAGGNVSSLPLISPDGSRAAYRADQNTDDVFEIFSVPSAGGTPIKLNGTLVANGGVSSFQFGPDSSRVLYYSDQNTHNVFEIFSVPSAGGAPVKLNGTLVAGGDVQFGFQFSSDSSRVLYLATQDTTQHSEIYSVPSTGGAAVRLNDLLPDGGNVSSGAFSPNSSRVVYLADQNTDDATEIYSVPSAGGMPEKLNDPLVTGGDVFSFLFSPDSSRVVYQADQNIDNVLEIFSVPSAGGTPVQLNGPLVTGGDVSTFKFSPDSSRVVYQASQNINNVFEIFSVPSGGGTPVKLNGPLVSGGVSSFQFSPDSSRVLYLAAQNTIGVVELLSVSSGGGTPAKLNGPLIAGGDVNSFQFSSDSSRVVYQADQNTDDVLEIFSVPSAGGTPVKLNGHLVAGGDVFSFQFSPDGSRVVYLADQNTNDVTEAFLVPSAGGTPVKLNGTLPAGGDVSSSGLQFSSDGSRVLYYGDQDANDVFEIFVRVIAAGWAAGSGSWDADANWNNGVAPDEVMQVKIDTPGTAIASGASTRTVNQLRVGGGPGTSTLELAADAGITVLNGLTLAAGGVIRGDGQIVAEFFGPSLGEVRCGAGQQLRVSSSSFTNQGRVEAIGTALASAEIAFDGSFVNAASSGSITARQAILRFDGGLTNHGLLTIGAGQSDVFGEINNTGNVVVSGGAVATFYDNIIQNGTLTVGKAGATTSTAVFYGNVSGSGGGTGGGDIFFEGGLQPGNSPALVTFNNNIALGGGSSLQIELAGTTAGGLYDRIDVNGELALGGTLVVSLINGFSPAASNSFDVLDWNSLTGSFNALNLPALAAGLAWDTSLLYTSGVLKVVANVAGDYNANGTVDAADYVVWRKDPNRTAPQYDLWRSHFGQPPGSGLGASANAAVPEPTTAVLLVLAATGWCLRRGRAA